tara:strand:+ start:202 stop:372 length:171 start_codon:yes stop_codon:yes gene_type:complete
VNTYQKIILAATLTFAFAWVSNDELAHDIKQAEQYKLDVCTGSIPDFKNIKPNCEE